MKRIPSLMTTATLLLASSGPLMAAGGEDNNAFAGSIYQSIAAIIAFVVLFVLLKKTAWGPILSGLEARETKIKEDLASAERLNAEAKQTLEDYKKQLAEAHAESRRILEQAKKDADSLRNRLAAEAGDQAAAIRKQATDEINMAKQKALNEIYSQAADLATSVAGQILGRQVNDADAQKLGEESLSRLSAK